MRLASLLVLACLAVPAGAEEAPDCKGFKAKHAAMVSAVEARAPGIETDRLREKADAYLTACIEDDDRLRSQAPTCTIVDGRPICRTE